MRNTKQTISRFQIAFFGVLILGTFFVGLAHGAVIDLMRELKMPMESRYVLSVVILGYVIFSIYFVSQTAKQLSAKNKNMTNIFLMIYAGICVTTFILIGYFSPITFAGNLSYQAATGTNVTTLFYPLFSAERPEVLSPIVFTGSNKEEKNGE
ncbi:MAG: hypothetical protein IT559_02650 [Alphaproteobacteria bacterium]|nr:hypothetical protein [Alphaproteobacteria bacterium]